MTRAQTATLLARAYTFMTGESLPAGGDYYDDDAPPHEDSIDGVTALGIAAGDGQWAFFPAHDVSRGQMAALLVRTLAVLEEDGLVRPVPATEEWGPAAVRFSGDGIDTGSGVLAFDAGVDVEQARTALADTLGPPTVDTGEIEPFSVYGTCPVDRLRVLQYLDGDVAVLFGGQDGGPLSLFTWQALDSRLPQAPVVRALLGGQVEDYVLGELTEGQLRTQVGDALDVYESRPGLPPGYTVTDDTGGIDGYLAEDRTTVFSASAGQQCGD